MNPARQLELLNEGSPRLKALARFRTKFDPKRSPVEIFQINVGKMCNQTCKHCHVDAGPTRKEIMTRETMEQCLAALEASGAKTVDLTGGAPEMNPEFRWLVEEVTRRGRQVIDRCNLTIIEANATYRTLPEFFARHRVQVVCSLPYYDKRQTDRQRGDGVFDKSITALRRLNGVGYGKTGTGLILDLVYNPVGAFLPAAQSALEHDFKLELKELFDIDFNSLYTITNMPISRFLEYLVQSGNLDDYQEKLVNAFNPAAAAGVMCRNTISISWDGYLYDCDFNQMLDIKLRGKDGKPMHIASVDWKAVREGEIAVNQHCYGCTAGLGSSCGGAVIE